MRARRILSRVWRLTQRVLSFLSTLLILGVLALTVLFLAKIKPYIVTTGSMEPALPVHSVCFVNENVPFSEIEVGQVIAFRAGENMLVTHRVIAVSGDACTTKGDANNAADIAPVTAENYIGRTAAVFPRVGIIMIFLHSLWGRIAAVSLIALLLVLSFLPKHSTEQEGGDEQPDETE